MNTETKVKWAAGKEDTGPLSSNRCLSQLLVTSTVPKLLTEECIIFSQSSMTNVQVGMGTIMSPELLYGRSS
jgi:hypothetical protein